MRAAHLAMLWIALGVLPSSGCSSFSGPEEMREESIEQGNRALAAGDHAAALAAYREALRQGDDARAHHNLGVAHYRRAESEPEGGTRIEALEAAEAAFRRAIGLTAHEDIRVSAGYNLGNTLFRLDRYDDAIAAYQAVLRLRPRANDARYNLELAMSRRRTAEPPPHHADTAPPPQAQPGPQPPQAQPEPRPGDDAPVPGAPPGQGQGTPNGEPGEALGQKRPPGTSGPGDGHRDPSSEPAGEPENNPDELPGSPDSKQAGRSAGDPAGAAADPTMDDIARRLRDLERTSQGLKRQTLKGAAQRGERGEGEPSQTPTPVQDW